MQGSYAGAGEDDHGRLLDEATAVVKEQAFYMKRAVDNDNLREALKHSSNLICELRTSLLSPKHYYELYMQVFHEMQHLAGFFAEKQRHGRKMLELYESVQHAGNILPRLYLLITVAASYIKSKEAPAKEILKDVCELCKGVQHPMRGLFLRYYLSQMVRDKLPDTGSEYEQAGGGDIRDAFEFVLNNFMESNRLWVRMQHQGPVRDKQRRERERHDLRVLVGANLVRLSQLDGMTIDYYSGEALPKLLEHVISVKDTMSQQYLFESMIQVFPDEYHLRTLEQILCAFTKAQPTVDMKPIMVTLMKRLADFLTASAEDNATKISKESLPDIFSLFRTHLQQILERPLEPGASGSPPDVAAPLELQAAFLQFTLGLYPDRLHYVDIILGSTVDLLRKFLQPVDGLGGSVKKLEGTAAEKVVEILLHPLRTLSLSVLEMEHYPHLMRCLSFVTRKQVALQMVNIVVEEGQVLSTVESLQNLCTFASPLLKDEEDTPNDEGNDKETFAAEQHQVCKMVHQIRVDDTDLEFQMLSAIRVHFGQGGPNRMVYTLQPTVIRALGLIPKIKAREESGAEPGSVTTKKVFHFLHKTITAMVQCAPEPSLRLWLMAAVVADTVDRTHGEVGAFEPICNEFLTQALICFEDNISDSKSQFEAIFLMVGTLCSISCLESENFDNVGMKITQHASRLLKKPQSCRAVGYCAHLFWCDARRDGPRVKECLQKCLKTADVACKTDVKNVGLWLESLDKYIYFFECQAEGFDLGQISTLLTIVEEHIAYAEKEPSAEDVTREAKMHLQNSRNYMKLMKESSDPEVAARWTESDEAAL